jgi:Protein of unknown function (DUF1838)
MTGTTAGDRGRLVPSDLARLLGGRSGQSAWQWFGGHAFAVMGDLEPLRELFEVEGCTVIRAEAGAGGQLRLVMRQVTLYRDPASRALAKQWRNPYSGVEVEVRHQHLPAVQATLTADATAPWLGTGERITVFLDSHAAGHFPLRPTPPGDAHRATSCAELTLPRAGLADGAVDAAGHVGAWQLLVDWPEWLGMGERPGYLFQRCFVRRLTRREDLPAPLRDEIRAFFPDGLDAPASG